MEEIIIVFVILFYISFAIVFAILYTRWETRKQGCLKATWEALQDKTGLSMGSGEDDQQKRSVGVYRGVPVVVNYCNTGAGIYTIMTAYFGLGLPEGLVACRNSLGTKVLTRSLKLEDDLLDRTLAIRGRNKDQIRCFFSIRAVAEALIAFVNKTHGQVTEQYLKVAVRDWRDNMDNIVNLLDDMVDTVLEVESSLSWIPEQDDEARKIFEEPHELFDSSARLASSSKGSARHSGNSALMDEPSQRHPGLERVLADLGGQGQGTDMEWSMDRAAAMEKMGKHQLSGPESLVLELIQAAQIKGATCIEIDVQPGRLRIFFDGAPFTSTDLEGLDSCLLCGDDSPDLRALKELAMGLNAGRSLHPRLIQVRSGQGGAGAQLLISHGKKDEISSCPRDRPGTEILMEGGPRGVYSKRARISKLVSEACRFSRVPVTVNGDTIRWDPYGEKLLGKTFFQDDELWGLAFFKADEASEVFWVKDGVLVEREPLEGMLEGFTAVVQYKRIRKDLSGRAIVRDEARKEALDRIQAAKIETLTSLARAVGSGELDSESHWWACNILMDSALGFETESLKENGPAHVIGSTPLWRTAAEARLSLAQILDLSEGPSPIAFCALHLSSMMVLWKDLSGEIMHELEQTLTVGWHTPPRHRAALLYLTRGRLKPSSIRSLDLPVDERRLESLLLRAEISRP